MNIQPVTLRGEHVTLVPLSMDHYEQMCEVGLDPELWQWTTTLISTPEDVRDYIQTALRLQAEGAALPFAIFHNAEGRVVGSSRFGNIDRPNRHVEIGWTWVARPWQRTPVNTEAKYLLLKHAFETLGCIRVEFKTDSLNEKSRAALQRIGAKQEGIFRNHMVTWSGRLRHSVYFSVIDSEWPEVKAGLEEKLNRS